MDPYDKYRNKPTDPGFWEECEIVDVEWTEEHKPHWWEGFVIALYDKEEFMITVQGDPEGNAFDEFEVIIDWEVTDVLD